MATEGLGDDPTVAGLIVARIDASEKAANRRLDATEKALNQRLDATEKSLNQRLDQQDRVLGEIKAQTTRTNGRVTALELARTRALGAVAAYRWIPPMLTAFLSAGITILLLAVTGGLH